MHLPKKISINFATIALVINIAVTLKSYFVLKDAGKTLICGGLLHMHENFSVTARSAFNFPRFVPNLLPFDESFEKVKG